MKDIQLDSLKSVGSQIWDSDCSNSWDAGTMEKQPARRFQTPPKKSPNVLLVAQGFPLMGPPKMIDQQRSWSLLILLVIYLYVLLQLIRYPIQYPLIPIRPQMCLGWPGSNPDCIPMISYLHPHYLLSYQVPMIHISMILPFYPKAFAIQVR